MGTDEKTQISTDKKKVLFLVGPTAVGKTEVAVELAKKINAEIISCDSMQIYKGMDIGTQKPSKEMRKIVLHHMIDILTADREFSVADFRGRALRLIRDIHKRNKIPLFVGGTGLYMKGLVDGLFPSPPKDTRLRERLYRQKGLYEKLEKIDPETAKTIHPNDKKKIVRALEVYYLTKKTMSELKSRTKPLTDKFDITIFGLIRPRDELYKRINERVDRMFDEGFLDEARRLEKKKLGITAMQAIGYKEILNWLTAEGNKRKNKDKEGEIRDNPAPEQARCGAGKGIKGVEELKELIKKNTRRYAKRQLTWFRKDKRVRWIEIKSGEKSQEITNRMITQIIN